MRSKDSKSSQQIFSLRPQEKGRMSSVREVLCEIQSRPAMHIGRHSLMCLRAFLDGWLARGLDLGAKDETQILEDFQVWIEQKFGMEDTRSWDRIIACFSQDDSDALDCFFELFQDFLEESSR